MEKKERTIKDIMDNHESMTDDELNNFKKIFETMSEFARSAQAYEGIDIKSNNNTPQKILKRQSDEYYVMAIVLESFFYCNKLEISFKQLNSIIYQFAPKKMVWDTSVEFINVVVGKMIFLGLIEPIKTDNEYIPNFGITKEGVKAFQDHRFQNLSATSFSNYQSYKTNYILLRISRMSLAIAIISAIIAIIAIITSITK